MHLQSNFECVFCHVALKGQLHLPRGADSRHFARCEFVIDFYRGSPKVYFCFAHTSHIAHHIHPLQRSKSSYRELIISQQCECSKDSMTARSKETAEPVSANLFHFVSFFVGSLLFLANIAMGFPLNVVLRSAPRITYRCTSTIIGSTCHFNKWGLRKHCQFFCKPSRRLFGNDRTSLNLSEASQQLDEGSDLLNEHGNLEDETTDSPLSNFTPGSNPGFFVVKQYKTATGMFDLDRIKSLVDDDLERLELTPHNISVPVALMLLDQDEFPSKSRARKACRKANIMIHRGPLAIGSEGVEVFDPSKCERARVGDRVFPGDVLAKQVRMGSGEHPVLNHKKPPFDLPVVYEDNHFAIGELRILVLLSVCSLI